MTKKVIGVIAVFIVLVLVVPLSAKGPGAGKNGQTPGALTDPEIGHIIHIREEEKLARDVYLMLYQVYEAPIFANISESEQRHMDAMKRLIDNYGLDDPVKDDTIGMFANEYFTQLYTDLVAKGNGSYCAALQVGIAIEELDIEDIKIVLAEVTAKDVRRVFNNLLSGSYNHLSAFMNQHAAAGCPHISESP
jgi:hypothetical protein